MQTKNYKFSHLTGTDIFLSDAFDKFMNESAIDETYQNMTLSDFNALNESDEINTLLSFIPALKTAKINLLWVCDNCSSMYEFENDNPCECKNYKFGQRL